jgi:uncharacterized protein YfaS (alpha-2-macroglobulin family)
MKHSFAWLTPLLVIAAGILLLSFQAPQAPNADLATATYSRGILHATIPYVLPRAGAGQLTVEVLDPEDQTLGRIERAVQADGSNGTWQADLRLTNALATDDLVWHRLRYQFTYGGEKEPAIKGTYSISEILRMPVMHILGQQSYLSGGPAAVRVIVTDSKNEVIAGPSSLRIELSPSNQRARVLFSGPLNRRGTTEAQFRLPAGLTGRYPLHYVVDTPLGSTEITQQVRLDDKASILLTTEKPIYQPGQVIHARALALDRSNHEATAGHKLTFEVEDPRGNKVFKQSTQTSKFGIASAEFALADEVNLGTYHLRAIMETPDGNAANRAELALNVEKYVLPKFKVAVDFTGKDQKAKHGYRPGDHVTGTVRANYFFGKPVDRAELTIKASSMDVAVVEVASVQAKTDADGTYHFDLTLPKYFAGHPLTQGAARVLIEATVKDSAAHAETRGEPITVSESPLLVTAVPEGGTLIAGLENQLFVLTSYADGKPAISDVRLHALSGDQTATTDSGGIAIMRVKPGSNNETLQFEANDKEGNHASSSIQLQLRPETDQILLRTEHAVYHAGDRIQLRVFSTKARGTAYIDVVKEGQTILTRDLDVKNGQAELVLTATPDMAGVLDFSAYQFGRDARPVGDHRLVFVQPADELKVEATADAPAYKPGEDARIRFRVTNSHGEGVQAALGLQVVDEAVFALAEKRPGFAKVFFYLEQEALKPRYEIHSIGMSDVVEPVAQPRAAQRDRAARALFAATEVVNANKFETVAGRTLPRDKYPAYWTRYRTRFLTQLRQISAQDLAKTGSLEFCDAWDTKLRVEDVPWDPRHTHYLLRSAGPDKHFDTGDDLAAYLEVRSRKIMDPPELKSFDLNIEHDHGPFNGLAEIAGSVMDQTGAVIPGATAEVREISTGKIRRASTNATGQFGLAGLPLGDYQAQVSSPGFQLASQRFSLAPRDRAVVSVILEVGTVTEAVVIDGAPAQRIRMGGNLAGAGGFAGGVIGGVVGGVPGGGGGGLIMEQMGQAAAMSGRFVRADGTHLGNGSLAFMAAPIKAAPVIKEAIAPAAAAHVRSYFPEALYINPQIITDQNGVASISIPMADSITTWRMAMLASTSHGALGSGTGSLKVFQDFFVDLDLPVRLTQGDRVDIPVAIYNYAGTRGNVKLQLQPDAWFSLPDDVPEKTLAVDPERVGSSHFNLEAKRIGKFKLTLSARMTGAADRADIVIREIEVIPNGREQNLVFNGRLETAVQHELNFLMAAIPDASKLIVRLYPGPLSQVVEGMDAILRMPGGCFEQTSSSTYPNVLALDYMKRIQKLTPEVHAKAEGFIANGYQRLLTFEVPGGGFSWFGNAPANKILTAYGLMEFSDMAKVHDVDPKVIQRTQQWLAAQQQADGSWKPDASFINEGATNRFNSDALRITAYLAWSLENTGYQGAAVEKAKQFVQSHMNDKTDSYTLAVLANFAADYGKDREFTNRAMQLLADARTEKDEQTWWSAEETGVYGRGASAAVETTGLAVQALLKGAGASGTASKALSYIAAKKDASGTWGTTQATIMALRALLLSTEKGAADVRGTVEISLNGKPVQKIILTPENNDLLHQFALKEIDANVNKVDIRFTGTGGLAYQVVGRYFVPWSEKTAGEPLSIGVAYDRTRLAQDDIATATATVKNNLSKTANMVMVDLGIPPGFDLLTEDLQDYQEKSAGRKGGRLEKFNLTATQAILYFDSIAAGDTITLHYRLRAKYPVRARTFQSRVYEYYDPDVNSIARPVQLEVRKR